jgi:hypothetical protein
MAWRCGRLWARRAPIVALGVAAWQFGGRLYARGVVLVFRNTHFSARGRSRARGEGGAPDRDHRSTALHIISRWNGLTWNLNFHVSDSSVYDPFDGYQLVELMDLIEHDRLDLMALIG